MKRKPFLAMELGSTKVTCLLAQPAAAGHQMLGCGLAPYDHTGSGWPNDPAILAAAVTRALDDPSLTYRPDRAVVALSHPALAHRQVTAQIDLSDEPITIRARDLQRLRAQALGQALGIDREVLLCEPLGYAGNGFDGVSDPRGLVATRLSAAYQLVTIPLAVRRAVVQALEMASLEVEHITYTLKALAATCLESEAAGGSGMVSPRVLLVDLGGASTDLAVVDRGMLVRTQTLAWGGQHVVEAVASANRLTVANALPVVLEGLSTTRPGVRQLIEEQLTVLQQALQAFLKDDARPERVVVTGRGALIDGLVEWIQQTTGLPSVMGRSPGTQPLGDLSRQVAFSPLMGLLSIAWQPSAGSQGPRSARTIDRLIHHTKHILVDYF